MERGDERERFAGAPSNPQRSPMLPSVPVPLDNGQSSPSPDAPPAPAASSRRRERWFSLELIVAIVPWLTVFILVQPPPPRQHPPAAWKQPAQSHQYRDQDMIARTAPALTPGSTEAWS